MGLKMVYMQRFNTALSILGFCLGFGKGIELVHLSDGKFFSVVPSTIISLYITITLLLFTGICSYFNYNFIKENSKVKLNPIFNGLLLSLHILFWVVGLKNCGFMTTIIMETLFIFLNCAIHIHQERFHNLLSPRITAIILLFTAYLVSLLDVYLHHDVINQVYFRWGLLSLFVSIFLFAVSSNQELYLEKMSTCSYDQSKYMFHSLLSCAGFSLIYPIFTSNMWDLFSFQISPVIILLSLFVFIPLFITSSIEPEISSVEIFFYYFVGTSLSTLLILHHEASPFKYTYIIAMLSIIISFLTLLSTTYFTHIWTTISHTLLEIWQDYDSKRLFIYFLINVAFMFVEFVVGIITNSLGMISDAGHMFFDSTALLFGLIASCMANWPKTSEYSYGYHRIEIVIGLVNAVFLVLVAVFVTIEALHRIAHPPQVHTKHLLPVAVIGLLVNVIGILYFNDAPEEDESVNDNINGVYLHVIADALGSVGVIISTIVIYYTGWMVIDPICALIIAFFILLSVSSLLSSTTRSLLQRIPREKTKQFQFVLSQIKGIDGVVNIYHVHLWKNNQDYFVCTLHLLIDDNIEINKLSPTITKYFTDIGINDVTIQFNKSKFLVYEPCQP